MKTAIVCILAAITLSALAVPALGQDFYYSGDTLCFVSVSNTKITIQFDTLVRVPDMGQFIDNHPCLNAAVAPEAIGRSCAIFDLQPR